MMSDYAELRKRILDLPPKRVALLALELQEQLEKERAARAEPIAVIGMGCRFPGASNSPDAYWSLLEDGRDAIVEVPADRWDVDALYDPDPDAAGKVATRWGGFLDDVQRFDSEFFSISPREARAMDPQQRILLETTWRAFEDAGIPPSRYYGAKAGVFIGICNNDYLLRLLNEGAEAMDLYLSSGNAYSVAAGRVAFTLGFQGPAIAVDTACSSSLVALHSACQSLLNGESNLAVAGGVNVLCSAETTMALSRSHMMAPDGRCKTFDDRADGFVRAEGCGVLLLKRLSDALRDGDRIHALIRGTAINQDGRSTGLTVPNGPAQEQVVRDALAHARLMPTDIDYIEAHGTGTSLGDPIEIRALGRVFGTQRSVPLLVGSVKTNLGHLESAAGIAGVIKVILSIRHGRIPRHLHFEIPSRHIDWDEYAIEVPGEGAQWPETGRPRRAGVSSFGFSGTNAHVIVEQAPERVAATAPAVRRPAELLLLSGTTSAARDAVAGASRDTLVELSDARFADFCHMTRVGRTAFGYRSAIVAGDRNAAIRTLVDAVQGVRFDSPARVVEGPGVVFMFTGQGAQHPGMGRALYETAPAFREAIDRCAAILDPLLELPLTQVLFEGSGEDAPIYRTSLAQPSVVAFEYALAELWRAWGVQPAAVLGHSLGEYVAATVAGVLRLEEMLPLVCERGRLLESLPGGHRMAAVFASAERLAPILASHRGAHIAAYNAPENTVLCGPADIVSRILGECAAHGIEHRILRLDQAFHSPGVEPVMDALQAAAAGVTHYPPRIPMAWNVTGEVGGAASDAGQYWRNHARQPVRFTQGVRALAEQGFRCFLEVGPHPTLSPLVSQAVDGAIVVASQRRGGEPWQDIAEAAAQLYVHGVDLDWRAYNNGFAYEHVGVPGHPFGGDRYWVDAQTAARQTAPRGVVPGVRLSAAVPIFETIFTPDQPAFLEEHRFRGRPLLPGPLFAELGRAAAHAAGLPDNNVSGLEIRSPAFIEEAGTRIQTVLETTSEGTRFRVLSSPVGGDASQPWTEHASGWLSASVENAAGVAADTTGVSADSVGVAAGMDSDWQRVDIDSYLRSLDRLGFQLGPSAALYADLEIRSRRSRARLVPPDTGNAHVAVAVLLDSAIQVLAAALTAERQPVPRMLTRVERITYTDAIRRATRCDAILHDDATAGVVRGDVTLLDAAGTIVATIAGVALGRVTVPAVETNDWFLKLDWRPVSGTGPAFSSDDVQAVSEQLSIEWLNIASAASLEEYVDWLPAVRERVVTGVWKSLVKLGLPAGPDLPGAASLSAMLGIAPRHGRLFRRLLSMLTDAGVLDKTETGFNVVMVPADPDGRVTPASCVSVSELVERCAAELAGVLTGEVDPLHLLFPAGSADTTRAVYQDSPFGRAFNEAVAKTVAGFATTRDSRLPLRILEIGAGSGSTGEAVLDRLNGRTVEYTFTDISPTLVNAAQARLGDRAGASFRVLDIESEVHDQQFGDATCDVAIAANVLHATADITAAVRRAAGLLQPGGVFVILEGMRPEPWVDITFGLTDGWWRFQDHDLRADYPLISRDRWQDVLLGAGFEDVTFVPADRLADEAGQVIIIARKPAVAPNAPPSVADDTVVFDARRKPDAAALLQTMKDTAAAAEGRRLWIVTENAQAVTPADSPDPDAAALWGLGRTFALEHPERWGGLIDLDRFSEDDAQHAIAASAAVAEDQVAYRAGVRYHARLVPAAPPETTGADAIEPGTYLVTGGLGGVGLRVAQWLANRGATRIVLTGRTASPDRWAAADPRHATLHELIETGVEVVLRAVDVTDRSELERLFAELRSAGPPLRGILHAAAVFENANLIELGHDGYHRVFAPKAAGATALAGFAREFELKTFVLFSSTTALLGVGGLGAYAAANQHLDALAVRLRHEGIPALAVNWGLWDEMRLADDHDAQRYEQAGLLPMESSSALDALGRLIAAGATSAVVADVDWTRLRALYEARRTRPLLAELGTVPREGVRAAAGSDGGRTFLSDLATLAEGRRERVISAIEDELRVVLRTSGAIDADRGFFELGMDSLMSVELKTRLEKRFGTRLPATLTFNYPNVIAVAGFMEERVAAMVEETASRAAVPANSGSTPVAPAISITQAAPGDPLSGVEDELDLAAMLQDRLEKLGLGGQS